LAIGYNKGFKSRKMDMGSIGLARDIIYNKGGYFMIGFNKSKKNGLIILPECICEM